MRHLLLALPLLALAGGTKAVGETSPQPVLLPTPQTQGELSLEEALSQRRSIRDYAPEPLTLAEVGQILWAAQGITHPDGYRTAPSAGALYPLEVYLVAGDVTDLPPGVYRYRPLKHELIPVQSGELRAPLCAASLGQESIEEAPAVVVITAVYERTARKYGQRARRYVHIEVGHAAQNVYLQAAADGLATVIVGAFHDEKVQSVLGLPADHEPLALMPLGHPR
jgi:SagB-type dehydrogenase family enzyme